MQDRVDIYTQELIRAIRESREYSNFCQARNALAGMPDLKRKINEYRRDTYRLQNESEEESLYDKVQEFNAQHAQFRKDPLVNDYLSSELAVCRMLQKVIAALVAEVDIELDDIAGDICL